VILGADFIYGELPELEAAYRGCLVAGEFDFSRWGGHALSELTPLWMLKYLPNMAACHIGIARDARGPNNTIVLGEASSLLAISEGARIIERGAADAMIVGGISSRLHPAALAYRASDQLSHRNDDPQRASRPFDARRDGMVNGEGAGTLVLEASEHARRRGARVLGRVLGTASRFEPGLPNGPLAPGKAIRAALAAALQDADLKPQEIGHVSAHGVSTIERDRAEAGAIRDLLGDVPVTAPKSYFGNAGAASGAVEAVVNLLALERGEIPVTLNYEHLDPECPVCVVAGRPRPIERPTVALLGHNTMGQAATVILAGP
jgi:3-oxoacyl-[acyl-carrier-protein] synthase II